MMYCRHVSWYLTRLRKLPTKGPRCNGPVGRSPVKITGAAPQEVIAALMQNLSKIEKDEFWQMKTFYHRLCGCSSARWPPVRAGAGRRADQGHPRGGRGRI